MCALITWEFYKDEDPDSVGLGWDLGVSSSNKLPGDTSATSPQITLREQNQGDFLCAKSECKV